MDHSLHANHGAHAMPDHNSMDGDGMDVCMFDMAGMDMGMKMYFHGGYCEEHVLFFAWQISSKGALAGSVIGVFFLAILYEGLKYFREYLFKQANATVNYTSVSNISEGPRVASVKQSIWKRILSMSHFAQTGLHVVQVALSYFLMLIFMTYNYWLCIGVVAGAGVGFFMFGWKKTIVVDITEHCH